MLRRRLIGHWLAAVAALVALVVTGPGSRPALAQHTAYTYSADHISGQVSDYPGPATSGLTYEKIPGNVPMGEQLQGSATLTFSGQLASGISQITDNYPPPGGHGVPLDSQGVTPPLSGALSIAVGTPTPGDACSPSLPCLQYAVWLFDFVWNSVKYEVQVGFPYYCVGQLDQGCVAPTCPSGFPTCATITFTAPQGEMKIMQKGKTVVYKPLPGPVNFQVTTSQP